MGRRECYGRRPLWPPPARRFPATLRSQQGMGFISILFALLALAALYFGYLDFGVEGAKNERSSGITAIDRSKDFACRTNRQTIEREIAMWRTSHEGEPASLAALGTGVTCPEGGRYSLSAETVRCSIHP